MGIVRFAFLVLIVIATASLLSGAASLGLAALGAMLFLPLLLFKMLLIVMLFGFFGRKASGWQRPPRGTTGRSGMHRQRNEPAESAEDRFDEWHRMAHARKEVESWTPEV